MKKAEQFPYKPIVLVILDGWGICQSYEGNAITEAKTPVFDGLVSNYPSTTLISSGEAVGLNPKEKGNSEIGHLTIGSGRIVYQDLPRINQAIKNKSFFKNEILLKAVTNAKTKMSKLHLVGILSDSNIHGSLEHLKALLLLAKKEQFNNVYLHVILDGDDTPRNNGIKYIKEIMDYMRRIGVGNIATISGRIYAMDKNNNWDRTLKAYRTLVEAAGNSCDDPISAIEQSYAKQIFDEEFAPTSITKNGKPVATIDNEDSVIFYNFRPDRAKQLAEAMIAENFKKFKKNKNINNIYFTSFTEYDSDLKADVAFPQLIINNTLGDVLAHKNIKQWRIAETEKYAHITYFFEGECEKVLPGNTNTLISSPQESSFDSAPEMSSSEITKEALNIINSDKFDFILINYANADMVAHTGNFEAVKKSIEALDRNLGKLEKSVLSKNGLLIITADHGNAETMIDMQTGETNKNHTVNPVPFILVGKDFAGRNIGWENVIGNDLSLTKPSGTIADIAPTILKIFGINKPTEMTGKYLF